MFHQFNVFRVFFLTRPAGWRIRIFTTHVLWKLCQWESTRMWKSAKWRNISRAPLRRVFLTVAIVMSSWTMGSTTLTNTKMDMIRRRREKRASTIMEVSSLEGFHGQRVHSKCRIPSGWIRKILFWFNQILSKFKIAGSAGFLDYIAYRHLQSEADLSECTSISLKIDML